MRTCVAALTAAALLLSGCRGNGDAGSDRSNTKVTKFSSTTAWPSRDATNHPTPTPTAPVAAPVPEPPVVHRLIPFGSKRRHEMAAYSQRHYGRNTYALRSPHVVVEHYTETPTFSATYNTFASDVPDSELHELPGTCAHFVIDRDGTIYQLVPLSIMCRHTVGVNWTAIGIEHVGMSDAQVMDDRRQLDASLKLTRWLRCRFDVAVKNVIGHSESLSSPYHHELVPSLRTQTHADMQRPAMDRYRHSLARLGC